MAFHRMFPWYGNWHIPRHCKLSCAKTQKNSYFPKHALRVSLPFVLRVSFIFLQEYRKVSINLGRGKLSKIEIAYFCQVFCEIFRGGSRTAATSKMELFLTIVNGFQPLTVVKKSSILDVTAALDPPS